MIIIFNGISSSGKSTISKSIVRVSGLKWRIIDKDDITRGFGVKMVEVYKKEYSSVDPRVPINRDTEENVLRIQNEPNKFQSIMDFYKRHVKDLKKYFIEFVIIGFINKVKRSHMEGYNVICDRAFINYVEEFDLWNRLLWIYPVVFVKLDVDIEVAIRRERDRKNRKKGLCIEHSKKIDKYYFMKKFYDVRVDVSNRDSDDIAKEVLRKSERVLKNRCSYFNSFLLNTLMINWVNK